MTNKYDVRFLDNKETYSLLLSAIYASECDSKYKLLSDLVYTLDNKSFKAFLTLYEGQTITIPSLNELTAMLKALTIFTYKDLQGMKWPEIRRISGDKSIPNGGTPEYKRLKQLIRDNKITIGGILDGLYEENNDN